MKYEMKSDHPVTNEACKAGTGKTLDQWYRELDDWDGLKKGRRLINNLLYEQKLDLWWCTTIAVEYEKHHDLRKKDGSFEGYFVCSTKTIAAPVEKVFDTWTSGSALSRWFGDSVKADVKDGGDIQSKDGDKGKVQSVRKNKDIRLTMTNQIFSTTVQIDSRIQDKG